MSDNTLISFKNHHKEDIDLSMFENNPGEFYVGYFENMHGEQWVFIGNRKTNKAWVTGGDVDWNNYDVEDGVPLGIIVNQSEALWIASCWAALTWKEINFTPKSSGLGDFLNRK